MNLETTRRSFLFGLAALLFAPVAKKLPAYRKLVPGPRRWLWVHASKFMPDPSNTVMRMTSTAQRSDGEYFYVFVREYVEDSLGPPELVRKLITLDMRNARMTLDDCLNCDCVANRPCARHYIPPPAPEEPAEYANLS